MLRFFIETEVGTAKREQQKLYTQTLFNYLKIKMVQSILLQHDTLHYIIYIYKRGHKTNVKIDLKVRTLPVTLESQISILKNVLHSLICLLRTDRGDLKTFFFFLFFIIHVLFIIKNHVLQTLFIFYIFIIFPQHPYKDRSLENRLTNSNRFSN